VITKKKIIEIGEFNDEFSLVVENKKDIYKEALFFDLEHYVYKKPICVGVFGCAYYNEIDKSLIVTQYMIESKKEADKILILAKNYFDEMMEKLNKKYLVTFSGNNDYTIINYLFKQNKINVDLQEKFIGIDLQKQYEKVKKTSIGLKNLEKEFGINRDSELISGSNLAKTFSKIIKDDDYINRMPKEKKEKILLYNEQDVVSLFKMYINWDNIIKIEDETLEKAVEL
jgi:uncharacterized protein YprB with RNaseH-like and TPR domain